MTTRNFSCLHELDGVMASQKGDKARPLGLLPQPLLQLWRRLFFVYFLAERLRLRQQILFPHALASLSEVSAVGREGSLYRL